jgi:hypothetical protein
MQKLVKEFLYERLNEEFSKDELQHYADIFDDALDKEYHYGLAKPGTFGAVACISSAKFALDALEAGETDLEKISDAVHKGWAETARTFDDPVYKEKPAKKQNRLKLADTDYFDLPEEEKEKDRVGARAIMQEYSKKV